MKFKQIIFFPFLCCVRRGRHRQTGGRDRHDPRNYQRWQRGRFTAHYQQRS